MPLKFSTGFSTVFWDISNFYVFIISGSTKGCGNEVDIVRESYDFIAIHPQKIGVASILTEETISRYPKGIEFAVDYIWAAYDDILSRDRNAT